jgi:hypothetical protein
MHFKQGLKNMMQTAAEFVPRMLDYDQKQNQLSVCDLQEQAKQD